MSLLTKLAAKTFRIKELESQLTEANERLDELEGHYPEELASATTHKKFLECVCGKNDSSCPDWWRYEGPRLQSRIDAAAEQLSMNSCTGQSDDWPDCIKALKILKPTPGKEGG